MRKGIALLLSIFMILGIFTGCRKMNGTEDNPATVGAENTASTSVGSLVVNAYAAVTITYDNKGVVLSIEGLNDEGDVFLQDFEDQEGNSCSDAICAFVKDTFAKGYLSKAGYVVVKQSKGADLPDAKFLETIQTEAQATLDKIHADAPLVMITEKELNEDGYINVNTAKVLVEKFLGVESLKNIDGTSSPVDGFYSFSVTYDAGEDNMIVNAVTGGVSQGYLSEPAEE